MMNVLETPRFSKQVKKLHKNQKKDLDEAIKEFVKDPAIGEEKKGDLRGVQVYKFKMVKQLTLLAYDFNPQKKQIILLDLGSHENFYRDLKK